MSKLLTFFVIVAASLSPVVWFAQDADLQWEKADATASTALQSKIITPERHIANQTTTRILALDQPTRLTFWTFVLKSKKQTCDVVVWTSYQGGTESGLDYWMVGCRDGHEYSISVESDAMDSVCVGNAFDRSGWRHLM
jgi:hypothetical protein